jgi:RNA polymerase sigma factor (sigma-70 family)
MSPERSVPGGDFEPNEATLVALHIRDLLVAANYNEDSQVRAESLAEAHQEFGELIAITGPRLWAMINRHSHGDIGYAEDLSQETYMLAYKGIHSFKGTDAQVDTWLTRIMINQHLKHMGTRKFVFNQQLASLERIARVVEMGEEGEVTVEDMLPLDPDGTPEYEVISREHIAGLINRITKPEHRATVYLTLYGGWTRRMIADYYGVSEIKVRGWYYRGLDKIREEVAKENSASNETEFGSNR